LAELAARVSASMRVGRSVGWMVRTRCEVARGSLVYDWRIDADELKTITMPASVSLWPSITLIASALA
jgi:hypothetical protein